MEAYAVTFMVAESGRQSLTRIVAAESLLDALAIVKKMVPPAVVTYVSCIGAMLDADNCDCPACKTEES